MPTIDRLSELDQAGWALAWAAREALATPAKFPAMSPAGSATQKVANLEASLAERYAADLAMEGWHGPTSFQRMIWQDTKTLELLAEPDCVCAVIHRWSRGEGLRLGPTNLGRALLEGLSNIRPAYLLSACPNWPAMPDIDESRCSSLIDMRPPPGRVQKVPYELDACLIDLASTAMDSFALILEAKTIDVPPCFSAIWEAIGTLDDRRLRSALAALVTPQRCSQLVHAPSVLSTAVERMRGQAFEVLELLPRILAAYQDDLPAVLGLGLVSHALDPKHLLACVSGALGTSAAEAGDGPRQLAALLTLLEADTGSAESRWLLAARFRQSLQLVADHATDLRIAHGELMAALGMRPAR